MWNFRTRGTKRGHRYAAQRALYARIEPLEARQLLSYVVTSLADDGSSGTLRYEIQQANSAGGDQTVSFDPTLTNGGPATIALNSTALEIDDTSGTLTIDGPGLICWR